jgi:hypothetical protein
MAVGATGSKTITQYVTEVTAGTLPATPAFKVLPVESNTLKVTAGTLTDNTLRSDRMGGDVIAGAIKVDGDIKFNMRCTEFDDLLANLFMGTWTLNVLKAGSTITTQAIELGYTDIAQYNHFLGLRAASLSFSLKPGALVPATMTFMGLAKSNFGGTTAATSSTMYTKEPFTSFTGSILEGGSPTAIVTGLDISFSNNLAESLVLFSRNRVGISAGNITVTGTLTAQFLDVVLFNKFINSTSSSLSFTLIDPLGKTHVYAIPKIIYTSADITVSSAAELTLSLAFHAQYDSTSATKITLTRTV